MSRPPSPLVAQRHEGLRQRIRALKAAHPVWGYRRIWAYLRCIEPPTVKKKRIGRLMREHDLLGPPNGRLQAKRTPTRSQPKPTKPNEWGGIDMTQVLVEGCGWVDLVVGLDGDTTKIVGYEVGLQSTTQQWLAALDRAVNRPFPAGARGQGLSLMRANGGQPTSMAGMHVCNTLGIHQVFTSSNTPTGNADTERVRRTLKAECRWLHEWPSPLTVASALERWIDEDNEHYWHSALGDTPPRQFEREDHGSHGTQFTAA
jgi:putative transposase